MLDKVMIMAMNVSTYQITEIDLNVSIIHLEFLEFIFKGIWDIKHPLWTKSLEAFSHVNPPQTSWKIQASSIYLVCFSPRSFSI